MPEIWERLENETPRAFECFSVYRDLREGRTVRAAYRIVTGNDPASGQVPGFWNDWVKKYNWQNRVKEYDLYLDRIRLEEQFKIAQEDHAKKLEKFRAAHEQVGVLGFSVALRTLQEIERRLRAGQEELSHKTLIEYARIANQVLGSASSFWSQSLGVDSLLRHHELENMESLPASGWTDEVVKQG